MDILIFLKLKNTGKIGGKMKEQELRREIEKCKEVLQSKNIKRINQNSIGEYLKSLEDELYANKFS